MYHNVPKIYCMRDETLKYPWKSMFIKKLLYDRIQMCLLIICVKENKLTPLSCK